MANKLTITTSHYYYY